MATLGDMRTRIAQELQINASVYATDIDNGIFTAIEFYNDSDYWFLDEAPTTLVLGTGSSSYALSSILPSYSNIKHIQLQLHGTGNDLLEYRTIQEFLDLDFDSNFTGDPLYWTVDHGALLVLPRSQSTFTAVIWHSARMSLTASASASGVWTNEAEELIRVRAEYNILELRMKDYEQASRKLQYLTSIVEPKMDEKSIRRRGSRRIKPFM